MNRLNPAWRKAEDVKRSWRASRCFSLKRFVKETGSLHHPSGEREQGCWPCFKVNARNCRLNVLPWRLLCSADGLFGGSNPPWGGSQRRWELTKLELVGLIAVVIWLIGAVIWLK